MNFSDNDLTGVLAEQDLERLFTSWRWVVGKDRLDIGYDLSVVPDVTRFKGARFLVQSKGTAKRKNGSVIAKVSKRRLQEYAENPHPVFIVRVMPDGFFYWLHAQEWAKQNLHKLGGDGDSGVKFDTKQVLTEKEQFNSYLEKVLSPAHEKSGSLIKLSEKRSQYLSAIDPRFIVKTSLIDGKESYEVFATPGAENPKGKFKLKIARTKENIEKLKEAIDFGMPVSLEADEFRLEGSPLFDEIGASRVSKGVFSIRPANISRGAIHLYSGATRSITAKEVIISANLFSGEKGFVINNEENDFPLMVKSRFSTEVSAQGSGKINFTINNESLTKKPIREIKELEIISEWAEQVLTKNSFRIEMMFRGIRAALIPQENTQDFSAFLVKCVYLGRLHSLAKYFDSEITLPENHGLTEDEENNLLIAYKLLRGEQCSVNVSPMEFEAEEGAAVEHLVEVCIKTNFELQFFGKELGQIPIQIDLPSCRFEKLGENNKHMILPDENKEATVSFLENEKPDGLIKYVKAHEYK